MTGRDPRLYSIASEAAYMAKHPRMFTKREMTVMLAEAAKVIEDLRAEIEIEDDEPGDKA